jgi:hypothetical protein
LMLDNETFITLFNQSGISGGKEKDIAND